MTFQDDYEVLERLATIDEAGGLAKERSVLLLWFLRNVVGLDDLDAYEFICDGDDDGGVDALRLERSSGDDAHETLVIYQSKYTQRASEVGPGSVDALIARSERFKSAEALREFIAEGIELKLHALITEFDLLRKLDEGAYAEGMLKIRLVFVTSGKLNRAARNEIEAANSSNGDGYITAYDIRRLGPLARAVMSPEAEVAHLKAASDPSDRLVLGNAPNRVAIASVKATDIVTWPGIEDRTLFALNVRRELRRNRVSRQLDGAIAREHDHSDFLAFHNGLTMVCESFEEKSDRLEIEKPSVVNGTQSVLAFFRGNERSDLTEDLKVFVKIVEVSGRPQLAKEVSWRSNTQSAVNARNLMALGGPQDRIKREFEQNYPTVLYETRPDASLGDEGNDRVIANDDAAQLLCAVFNAMPWLAVKRLVLFESENHAMIFSDDVHAEHVYMADLIREAIDDQADRFPDLYRKSWRLTRIVAVYLVGQILRTDPSLTELLTSPGSRLSDPGAVKEQLKVPVRVAAATLKQRWDLRESNDEPDDFNREFKNQQTLHELRDSARGNYNLLSTMSDSAS